MSDGIRGGGGPTRPPLPTTVDRTASPDAAEVRTPQGAPEAPSEGARPLDVFENSGANRAPRELKLTTGATRSLSDVQFNDQELAKIAATLIAIVKKNPKASRANRAKAFTRAILRGGGKLARVIEKMDEQEAERMFDDIATILADSPRLAEWIDSVSDEANRLNG